MKGIHTLSCFAILFVFFVTASLYAAPTNGDFALGLDSWNVEYVLFDGVDEADLTNDGVYIFDEYAVLAESYSFVYEGGSIIDVTPGIFKSILYSDTFTLDTDMASLSFDMQLIYELSETDKFTVSLYDTFSIDSDGTITGTTLGSISGQDYYYYLDSSNVENMASGVSVTEDEWNTVNLDISSWIGSDVVLVFELENHYEYEESQQSGGPIEEDSQTFAHVDNVRLVPVPTPGAILLAGLGTTLVAALRRHKKI